MSITRYRNGAAEVAIDGDLAAFVDRAVKAASAGVVEAMQAAAEEVRAAAEAAWYQQVDRDTGQSGDLAVVTTVDLQKGTVRVSVGSTDTRKDKRGRPAVAFIHRPRVLSLVSVEITSEEYRSAKAQGHTPARLVFHAFRDDLAAGVQKGLYYRNKANPAAADGKVLLQELIRKPMKKQVTTIAPEISRLIAARIANGR